MATESMTTPLIQRILAERERTKQLHLLIVDNDEEVSGFLEQHLSAFYQVHTVRSGQAALAFFAAHAPNMMLVDSALPDMDTLTLLRTIRDQRHGHIIPIIVLGQPEDSRERKLAALELGVDDYITKPFDIDELRYRIRNILPNPHQNADLITGLPGWLTTEYTLRQIMNDSANWTFMLITIQHFRIYRLVYGYVAGNTVLRSMAQLLEATVSSYGRFDDFIGYVGEEDFVILTTSQNTDAIIKELRQLFHNELPVFYTPPDLARGWIQIANNEPAPLMWITVSQVNGRSQPYTDTIEIIQAAEAQRPHPDQ